MTDIFTPDKRSEVMSKIRGKNTKPELLVFRYLRSNKVYFRKHYRTKQGIVLDLALPRKKRAVFVDGDFWHGRTLEHVVERRGEGDFWTMKLRVISSVTPNNGRSSWMTDGTYFRCGKRN